MDRIDNENTAAALQRNVMRAFFTGGYQDSLTLAAQIDKTGIVSPRTLFYRACSLAALAATSTNPSQDKRLADAKRYYAEAAKAPEPEKRAPPRSPAAEAPRVKPPKTPPRDPRASDCTEAGKALGLCIPQ